MIGRSPCGERGLKYLEEQASREIKERRSPCGERGLKYNYRGKTVSVDASLPVRGAWIEISTFLRIS